MPKRRRHASGENDCRVAVCLHFAGHDDVRHHFITSHIPVSARTSIILISTSTSFRIGMKATTYTSTVM